MAASRFDSAVIEPIERIFDSLGLMTGTMAPMKRALVGAAVVGGFVWIWKPDFMFNENGTPKQFGTDGQANETLFPWWAASLTGAVVFGVLI